MTYHTPVLLGETIDLLQLHTDGTYVDATLGGGGHFAKMLEIVKSGYLFGIDADSDAINKNREELAAQGFVLMKKEKDSFFFAKEGITVILVHGHFSQLDEIVGNSFDMLHEKRNGIDGILFDLGVSSYQIDTPTRGFSYMQEGPLDMRMDSRLLVSAADLVNGMYEKELERVLREYGEEIYAKRIAKHIIEARKKEKIVDSEQLKEVIKKSVPYSYKNPYAKTFQALRIAVNDELGELQKALIALPGLLKNGGRVAIISFHSLEDRIVKKSFKGDTEFSLIARVNPSDNEVEENKRSRSATLRVYEKHRS